MALIAFYQRLEPGVRVCAHGHSQRSVAHKVPGGRTAPWLWAPAPWPQQGLCLGVRTSAETGLYVGQFKAAKDLAGWGMPWASVRYGRR